MKPKVVFLHRNMLLLGTVGKKESANGLQKFSSPHGRYGAPRPPCSMGQNNQLTLQIIHNQTTNTKIQEPVGVQSMPATNYQGVSSLGGPYPNYASQSVPNINTGQRILNNAYSQNVGNPYVVDNSNQPQYTGGNAQNIYNSQSLHHNIAINKEVCDQNQMAFAQNSQRYIDSQQPCSLGVAQNLTTMQHQSQYGVPQNISNNNNYSVNNYVNDNNTQNRIQSDNNLGEQGIVKQPNPQIENRDGSQYYNVNNPHVVNSQCPEQSNIPLQQSYMGINQRFENISLNNQPSSLNTATNDNMPSSVQYQNQNMAYRDARQDLSENPGQNVGYSVDHSNSNIKSTPTRSDLNFTNIPQNQTYVNANNTTMHNPIPKNVNEVSNMYAQYSVNNNPNLHVTSPQDIQYQSVTKSQDVIPAMTQQNTTTDQTMYSNQNNQQNMYVPYQDDVRRLASCPVLQNPQANSQMYSNQHHNIPQQQFMDSQPDHTPTIPQMSHFTSAGIPQSVASQPFNIEAGKQMQGDGMFPTPPCNVINVPLAYNQAHSAHNLGHNSSVMHDMSRQGDNIQNLSNVSGNQMSKHNTISESALCTTNTSSAPLQENNPLARKMLNETTKSSGFNPILQKQDLNMQDASRGDMNPTYEEGCLSYGYPPQFTKAQIVSHDVPAEDGEKHYLPTQLERPHSLPIKKSEEVEEITSSDMNDKNSENDEEPTNIQCTSKTVKIKEDESSNVSSTVADDKINKKTPSHLTNQGYFDIKFYHNKL
ncbi:hypothetical protein NQ315_013351, partial [Exocentrus adspersus]